MARTNDRGVNDLLIEDARIIFRNFSGKATKFKPEGQRRFCVILEADEKTLAGMADFGWNIKYLKPREEEDLPVPYLEVDVRFENFPPKIIQITSRGRTPLTVDMVGSLDYAEIARADVLITPYQWEVGPRTGIKAYLKQANIILRENALDMKEYDLSEFDGPTAI